MQRFETKYDLLNAAYKDVKLKKGTIALLQYLVHKSNKEQCFPAVETIAKALNVCKRTVQYNMRKLEKAGYVIRKDRWYNHQQMSNQYIFNFGITEDAPGQSRYSEIEKEKINGLISNMPEDCNGMKDEICQDKNNQVKINKAVELLKIYHMHLSSREKLLLIYLFHRANTKGVVYDIPVVFMDAIGIGNRTFEKLLRKLRNKNLIRIKYAGISGKKMLLIKLTGNVWKEAEASAVDNASAVIGIQDSWKNSQKTVTEQKQELKNNVQIIKNRSVLQKKDCRRINFRKINSSIWKNIWKKCKGAIQSGLEKIRVILRI